MTGLAVTEAAGALVPEDDEPEQLGLFGAPQTEAGLAKLPVKARGPGRPPGARNKRTERTVALLLSRYRDPREVLLEIAEANVADLAALLGCSPFEALQEKRLAATAVLPYMAARITPEVLNDNRQVVHLTINAGTAEIDTAGGAGAVAVVAQTIEHVPLAETPSAATIDTSKA